MTYTADTLTQAVQLDQANAIQRNAGEIRLLYPEPFGTDSAPLIQAELAAIGGGAGTLVLASGEWTISTGLTSSASYLAVAGMGLKTRLHVATGVDCFTLGPNTSANPTYIFSDMAILGGRTAVRVADNETHTAKAALECEWARLRLLNQERAAFQFNAAVYRSLFQSVLIEGDYATRPLYGIEVDAYWGFHANAMQRCSVRQTYTAALYCAGAQPNNVYDLTLTGCLFESNQGQVASLTNCNLVTFLGGWWENNCARVEAAPVPLIDFGNGAGLVVENTHVWPTGPGCLDPNDDNRAFIIRASANGHAFRGAGRGYIQFGDATHRVYASGRVDMDCRQRMVVGPDGQWYIITPGQVVNLEPA